MRRCLLGVFLLVLWTPGQGRAAPIELTIEFRGVFTCGMFLGVNPAFAQCPVFSSHRVGIPDFSGLATISSGALESMTELPPRGDFEGPGTAYRYAPGLFTLTAQWEEPGGAIAHGTFTAPIPDFTLNVRNEGAPPPCNICTHTQQFLTLGAGVFTDAFARYLGVQPVTEGGDLYIAIEFINGDPTWDERSGGLYAPSVTIAAQVPEPTPMLLGLVGVLMAARRAW